MNSEPIAKLIHAASRGQNDKIEALLSQGVDINALYDIRDYERDQIESSATALMAACDYNHFHTVKFLIEKGANVHLKSSKWSTAFMEACASGNLEIARYLLQFNPDLNEQNNNNDTALMLAVRAENKEMVNFLIDAGADVTIRHHDGTNQFAGYNACALTYAIDNSNLELARILLDKGATINLKRHESRHLVKEAISQFNMDALRLLVSYVPEVLQDSDCLFTLITTGRYEKIQESRLSVFKFMVEHGANIQATDEDGRTPLMAAAANGRSEIVDYLLTYQINRYAKDSKGATALIIAAGNQQASIVSRLLDAGFDLRCKDNHGFSAMDRAAYGMWADEPLKEYQKCHKPEENDATRAIRAWMDQQQLDQVAGTRQNDFDLGTL